MNKFSYTWLISADYLKLSICEVLIETNPPTRDQDCLDQIFNIYLNQ